MQTGMKNDKNAQEQKNFEENGVKRRSYNGVSLKLNKIRKVDSGPIFL